MGRDYEANNPDLENWAINSMGTDIIGRVIAISGSICECCEYEYGGYVEYNPLWEANGFRANLMAKCLDRTPDDVFLRLLDKNTKDAERWYIGDSCGDETPEEFLEWIKELSKWLKECKGYKVLG